MSACSPHPGYEGRWTRANRLVVTVASMAEGTLLGLMGVRRVQVPAVESAFHTMSPGLVAIEITIQRQPGGGGQHPVDEHSSQAWNLLEQRRRPPPPDPTPPQPSRPPPPLTAEVRDAVGVAPTPGGVVEAIGQDLQSTLAGALGT